MPSYLCPRCAKKFHSQTSVLRHLNQPISSCRSHYEQYLEKNRARRVLNHPLTYLHNELSSSMPNNQPNHPGHPMDQDSFNFVPPTNIAADTDHRNDHNGIIDSNDTSWKSTDRILRGYHVLEYDGAAAVYGQGPTFMDNFDNDQYASIRKDQLYYPFASRAEWEFACFLMESSLSMAALDRFLKLELVSFILAKHTFIELNISAASRYKILAFHFALPRIYAIE